MSTQLLKDHDGRVIGKLSVDANGVQTLRDGRGVQLGYFDPRINKTRTRNGHEIGTGNLLATLLCR